MADLSVIKLPNNVSYNIKDTQARTDVATKADKSATVSTVAYDSTNKKITKTINGTTSDVVTVATIKTALALAKGDVGLGNVTNDAQIPKSLGTAAGDIIYYTASGTPARLAKGSNGQVLKLVSGLPAWSADSNSDTNVTNTVNTTTKYYITGTSSATTSTGTQLFDTGIYSTTTAGQLNATSYKVNENCTLQYDSANECLNFVFS